MAPQIRIYDGYTCVVDNGEIQLKTKNINGHICTFDADGTPRPALLRVRPDVLALTDASDMPLLLHELTQMEQQFVMQEDAPPKFAELGVVKPVDAGFDYVAWRQQTHAGAAQFISRDQTNFPKVSLGSRPYIAPVIPTGVGFTVNFFQQQALNRFGIRPDMMGMTNCAEAIDLALDLAWHKGGTNPDALQVQGMFGFFNGGGANEIAAGTSIYKSTLGTGGSGNTWALKTGEEILVDIATGIADVYTNSKTARTCKKIAWGLNAQAQVSKKFIRDGSGSAVRLDLYLKANYPQIQFVVDPYFDRINMGASGNPHESGLTGAAGSSCVLFYDDAETNFRFRANRREIVLPYDHEGFVTTVNTYGLTAGIEMFRTYAFTYMIGVD